MRKIKNPFVGLEGYNCFGCSPDNTFGLQLSFIEEGDSLVATWDPKPFMQGYFNMLHGGIQATLMDEIASWAVYVLVKTAGFTSNLNIRYLKPVLINDSPLTVRARVKEMRRNLADIEVKLFNSENVLCADGLITYFTFSQERSKINLYYPDHKEFFEEGT